MAKKTLKKSKKLEATKPLTAFRKRLASEGAKVEYYCQERADGHDAA